jgi:hypothetical protein
VTFAHIGGLPVEESLPMLAPAAPLVVLAVRARLARLAAHRRRRAGQ